MNLVHKIEHWGDTHHPKALDVARVALGLFLLLKGVVFMENSIDLKWLIEGHDAEATSGLLMTIVYTVIFLHIVGGSLIALGIYTRVASIVQIPIVFTAVFFINSFKSPVNTELWYSITALILLILFTILGSGPLSLDGFLRKNDME
jgi:uncharacterized membrane protein YphA (DoxX/SURF4 family)